jgi:hypothetical protein
MKKIIFTLMVMVGLSACDYLEVVPDERATEKDAFADINAAKRFLHSCYSYLPNPKDGPQSLDLFTGDEVITAFEHETFARFPLGTFSASSPVISYWNTFFQGLRQCYIMLDPSSGIDIVPGMTRLDREDYKAQVHFLIGYYHFLMIRCYGPVILIKEMPDVNAESSDYLGRSTLDECVQFVCDEFDYAASILPDVRPSDLEFGMATKTAALALKAKMLLYAASPLFNGGGENPATAITQYLAQFTDKSGQHLMPSAYDPNKWVKAREAARVAVELAEQNYSLFDLVVNETNAYPDIPAVNTARYVSLYRYANPELIWSDNRIEDYNGAYGTAIKSLPHVDNAAWNGVAPTWEMLSRFYTKNGLPLEYDREFTTYCNGTPFDVKAYTSKTDEVGGTERLPWLEVAQAPRPELGGALGTPDTAIAGDKTIKFNVMREPRYYAWIAFQGGYYEVLSAATNGAYNATDHRYKDGRMVCDFTIGGQVSRQPTGQTFRTNDFAPSGFLNKKFVSPALIVSKSSTTMQHHPWPIMRLADLYLEYAEALIETGELDQAKIYIDKVRTRAGIPTVDAAWANATNNKSTTKEGMRDIVRQERQIEFYLENQNFWDLRRWLMGGYLNVNPRGMFCGTKDGKTPLTDSPTDANYSTRYNQIVTAMGGGGNHAFSVPTHYFLPIPIEDVSRNPNIIQNPGY